MPVIPPGYFNAAHQFDCPSPGGVRRSVCTMGHQGPLIQETLEDIATTFIENVWSDMGSAQYVYKGVVAYTETVALEAARTVPGTLGAQPLAPNTTLLMRKVTGVRGREFRGRCYWPGMTYESDVNEAGVIVPAQVSGFQTFFDGWLSDLNAINAEPFLLHESSSDPTLIQSFEIDGVVATQRRRLRR